MIDVPKKRRDELRLSCDAWESERANDPIAHISTHEVRAFLDLADERDRYRALLEEVRRLPEKWRNKVGGYRSAGNTAGAGMLEDHADELESALASSPAVCEWTPDDAQYERDLHDEIGKDRMSNIDPQDIIDRLDEADGEAVAQIVEERERERELAVSLLDTLARIREATGTERYELAQLPDILAHREDERLRLYRRLEQITTIAATVTSEGLRALDDATIRQVFAVAALQPEVEG